MALPLADLVMPPLEVDGSASECSGVNSGTEWESKVQLTTIFQPWKALALTDGPSFQVVRQNNCNTRQRVVKGSEYRTEAASLLASVTENTLCKVTIWAEP